MSKFKIKCPGCETTLQIKEELRGKQIECPKCQKRLRVATGSAKSPDTVEKSSDFNNALDPFASLPTSSGADFSTPANLNVPTTMAGSAAKSVSKRQPELSEGDRKLQSTGIFLVTLTVLAATLPVIGFQIRWLRIAGEFAPLIAMILGLIGSGMIIYARRRRTDLWVIAPGVLLLTLGSGIGGFVYQLNRALRENSATPEPAVDPIQKAREDLEKQRAILRKDPLRIDRRKEEDLKMHEEWLNRREEQMRNAPTRQGQDNPFAPKGIK